MSLILFTALWLCVEIRVVSEIFQNLKTVYLDIYKVRRSDTLTLPVSSRSWHGTKCIRKGEIMTVQTRIQTHALRISSQVLYQLGYLVPVIEPVFTVPQVEIVLKDIFLVLQIIFKIDFHV